MMELWVSMMEGTPLYSLKICQYKFWPRSTRYLRIV